MEKIEHKTFRDNRGSYTPIPTNVLGMEWDQCSISVNDMEYTFRGLHYQTNPYQTKYVKVIKGKIIDFMVDLETGETEYLIMDENSAVLVPNNKAHGFLTLVPNTIVVYMSKGEYNPESEHSILWWKNEEVFHVVSSYAGINEVVLSEKDANGK